MIPDGSYGSNATRDVLDRGSSSTRGCPISQSINPSVLRNAAKEPVGRASLEQASSWKGNQDDQCFVSSVTPALIVEWIGGTLLCPANSTCSSAAGMDSRAGQRFWFGSKGKEREPAMGRIRKEREAFPFFQLKPRVKGQRGTRVCVCALYSSSSGRMEPAPPKGFSRHLHWNFSLRFQGFLS